MPLLLVFSCPLSFCMIAYVARTKTIIPIIVTNARLVEGILEPSSLAAKLSRQNGPERSVAHEHVLSTLFQLPSLNSHASLAKKFTISFDRISVMKLSLESKFN